jgi:hypothetical protein
MNELLQCNVIDLALMYQIFVQEELSAISNKIYIIYINFPVRDRSHRDNFS